MQDPAPLSIDPDRLTAIVVAKAAVPGKVKTRLTRGEAPLSPEAAAGVHSAMFDAVLERVALHVCDAQGEPAQMVLAIDDPAGAPASAAGWVVVSQGGGDLGDRLERVWREVGGGPVAFFGVDCPDVPGEAMKAIGPALTGRPIAVGRVSDGGYWTLAADQCRPAVLRGIDWGTPAVYHQTLSRAREAGWEVAELPPWHDVDEPGDLIALRDRLRGAQEPSLVGLADRLSGLVAVG